MDRISKAEFIRQYAERSGIDPKYILSDGIVHGWAILKAEPCTCCEEGCDGWQMRSAMADAPLMHGCSCTWEADRKGTVT
jgi:hypothetical protein